MKTSRLLVQDIESIYGKCPDRQFARALLASDGACSEWECLKRFDATHRRQAIVVIPECMMWADLNPEIPRQKNETLEHNAALLHAIALLADYFGEIEPLRQMKESLERSKIIQDEFFSGFPLSQKRKNKPLTFQKLFQSHLERIFSQPFVTLSAAVGAALYPETPVDLDAVRRGRSRERRAKARVLIERTISEKPS